MFVPVPDRSRAMDIDGLILSSLATFAARPRLLLKTFGKVMKIIIIKKSLKTDFCHGYLIDDFYLD